MTTSHRTAGSAGPAVSTGRRTGGGVVVPAYFHPAVQPHDWRELAAAPDRVRLVILNLANGPGPFPDTAFHPVLDPLRAAGVVVAGYVDTDYGRRPAAAALADVDRYREWYAVTAVFLDQVATAADQVGHYAALAQAARERGATEIAFNHGVHPDAGYREHADLLGTFEGPWSAYRDLTVPDWAGTDRCFHLVHSVPPTQLTAVADLADQRGVTAYATTRTGRNPWRRIAGLPAAKDR